VAEAEAAAEAVAVAAAEMVAVAVVAAAMAAALVVVVVVVNGLVRLVHSSTPTVGSRMQCLRHGKVVVCVCGGRRAGREGG
jgi:hypothetical protein